jgi:hypothetical protein
MVAILAGSLALVVGLILLLLPLLASELSRPRDSVWGAVVLLMGLDLVTTAERLRGAPMLAVLCGGLLMVRLGSEVGRSRWRQLSPEEQQRLSSVERWRSSLEQLLAAFLGLVEGAGRVLGGLGAWVAERRRAPVVTKRWVRPDAPPPEATEPSEAAEAQAPAGVSGEDAVETVEVASFAEVEELLRDAGSTDKEDRATDAPPGVDAEAPEKADQAGETG